MPHPPNKPESPAPCVPRGALSDAVQAHFLKADRSGETGSISMNESEPARGSELARELSGQASQKTMLHASQAPFRKVDRFREEGSALPNQSEFARGSGLAREFFEAPQEHLSATEATPEEAGLRANSSLRVLYLLTTFPLLSETFVRREVRALSRLAVKLDIYSLWGGETEAEGHRVNLFPMHKLFSLLWWLPFWIIRKPLAFARLARHMSMKNPGSFTDFAVTMLGIAFALCHAWRFSKTRNRPELIHAGWATMPATAAQLLSGLTGVPFTFQANAYDIFRDGGDWLLPGKLREASLIMTSTEYARAALISRGAPASRVVMIRRGLEELPARCFSRSPRAPLRLLSVGRLVEKKGFVTQLEILAKLKAAGMPFEARIVGGGPLESDLYRRVRALGLENSVALIGSQSFTACKRHFQWADVFLFAGKVAANGDRDGLPNVICEAMACGVPVVSTSVAGVPEAVQDGQTGLLVSGHDAEEWCSALTRLCDDDAFYLRIRDAGRAWVQEHFDIRTNARMLANCFYSAAKRIEAESIKGEAGPAADPPHVSI